MNITKKNKKLPRTKIDPDSKLGLTPRSIPM